MMIQSEKEDQDTLQITEHLEEIMKQLKNRKTAGPDKIQMKWYIV